MTEQEAKQKIADLIKDCEISLMEAKRYFKENRHCPCVHALDLIMKDCEDAIKLYAFIKRDTTAMSPDFPLLTREEDANDFQLTGEQIPDDSDRITASRKAEADKAAEEKTPDLF